MTLPPTLTAMVFDCGDTLLHLAPAREEVFAQAAASVGVDISPTAAARAYQLVDFAQKIRSSTLRTDDDKATFYAHYNRLLCHALGIELAYPRLHPALLAHFGARRHWTPFADALPTLTALRARVPLYVLANWDTRLPVLLERAGLLDLFVQVYASETLGAEKPDPACYGAFLAQTGLAPSQTLYVGNEYIADVVGARAAGLTPVLVDRHGDWTTADCLRVPSLAALLPLLEGHLP